MNLRLYYSGAFSVIFYMILVIGAFLLGFHFSIPLGPDAAIFISFSAAIITAILSLPLLLWFWE